MENEISFKEQSWKIIMLRSIASIAACVVEPSKIVHDIYAFTEWFLFLF